MTQKKQFLQTIFRDTVPVLAGYVVLGMGFGMLMHAKEYGLPAAFAMSLLIYAGSMQYAALGLFAGGASLITVALTTLAVNARHFFYGISMLDRYRDTGKKKPYLIFALTDETYSLVCTGEKDPNYCFAVSVLDHCYWVAGTVIGYLLGSAIHFNTKGIEFALTALFLSVFTEQWMSGKDHTAALAGVGCTAAALIIFGPEHFLIPAMVLILAALLLKIHKRRQT